jgi:broad specificity phosphatase PhoE
MFRNLKLLSLLFLIVQSNAFASERYITIMRHGQADHNVGNFYNSNPEHPNYRPAFLTTLGKEQAAYTGLKLKIQGLHKRNIAAVITSPLPRTRQTANILAKSGLFAPDKIIFDDRVIEANAGSFEGQPYNPSNLDWDNPTVGGENQETLRCRMQNFYNHIIEQYPEGDIVVVTHGSPSKHLINLLTNEVIQLNTADSITLPITGERIKIQKC